MNVKRSKIFKFEKSDLLSSFRGEKHRLPLKRASRDIPDGPVVKTLLSNAGCVGLIPGWGTKILDALRPKNQNTKQKQCCNKFNKNFKNGPCKKNQNMSTKGMRVLFPIQKCWK